MLNSGKPEDQEKFRYRQADTDKPEQQLPGISSLDNVKDYLVDFSSVEIMFLRQALSDYKKELKTVDKDDNDDIQITRVASKRLASEALSTVRTITKKLAKLQFGQRTPRLVASTLSDTKSTFPTYPQLKKLKFKDLSLAILKFDLYTKDLGSTTLRVSSTETTVADFKELYTRITGRTYTDTYYADTRKDSAAEETITVQVKEWQAQKVAGIEQDKQGRNQLHLQYRTNEGVQRMLTTSATIKFTLKTLYATFPQTSFDSMFLYVARDKAVFDTIPLQFLDLRIQPTDLYKARKGIFDIAAQNENNRQIE